MSSLRICAAYVIMLLASMAKADDIVVTGIVNTDAGPLKGATVIAWTATPRVGPAYYCPGCYLDCGTQAISTADGTFTLKLTDPSLVWTLLVVAEGYVPQLVTKIDPQTSTPKVTMVARDWAKVPADRTVRGVVVDAKGQPLAGAVVEPDMVMFTTGDGLGGAVPGLDQLAVTNEHGEFRLAYLGDKGAVATMDLTASAKAFARKCVTRLKPDNDQKIALREGGTVTGRLVKDGRPLGGIKVGICLVNRFSDGCFGRDEIATLPDGRFMFANLPPTGEHAVYAMTESLKGQGVTEPKIVVMDKEGATVDAGDLEVVAGVTVAGRIILSDDKPLPAGAKFFLNHEVAWDSIGIDLPPSGVFGPIAVPRGNYSVNVAGVRAYEMSPKNRSYVDYDVHRLDGRIEHNTRELTVLMIPAGTGPKQSGSRQPEDTPLAGTAGFEGKVTPEYAGKVPLNVRVLSMQADGTYAPLENAEVRAVADHWNRNANVRLTGQERVRTLKTDARGECTFGDLSKGIPCTISCIKAGLECMETIYVHPESQRKILELRMRPESPIDFPADVTVIVQDEAGQPVPNSVVLGLSSWAKASDAAETGKQAAVKPERAIRFRENYAADADGKIKLWIADDGEALGFRVEAAGYAPSFVERQKPGEITIKLTRAASLTGLVRRANGEAVAGATVHVLADMTDEKQRREANGVNSMRFLGEAVTDKQGRYVVEGLPIGARAIAHATSIPKEGLASTRAKVLTPGAGEREEVEPIVVEKGLRLAGRVTVAEDVPWPGDHIVGVLDEDTREVWRATVLPDGTFGFDGIPRGSRIHVFPEIAAGIAAESDDCAVGWNNMIAGTLSESIENLAIRLVKTRIDNRGMVERRVKPLRGIEK